MTSSTSTSAVTTFTATAKVCFNSNCNKPLEQPRRGWRCRTGDFAELCDRCSAAYDESKFCENFHLNAPGWRCCETCGKQIHCGCIGSFHLFVLLDAGGIECITCTSKSFILTPNPAWPPPSSLFLPERNERNKEWSPIIGSGPVPWKQAPSLFNGFSTKYEIQPKKPFEIDVSASSSKEISHEIINPSMSQLLENGDAGFDQTNVIQQTHITKNDFSTPIEINNNTSTHVTKTLVTSSPIIGNNNIGVDISGKAKLKHQLLPRYWPRITDQELQQISGDTNSIITPLFEKILSASDAGRIGRLVLPKKCAEAYLPPIYHPEGLPLKMKDIKGNEWDFQFRFWPNNNSRMYVLEGVTPCIQSMQLQAGDIVTFSRIEPEGKFVMGGRKVSTTPQSDQGNEGVSNVEDVNNNKIDTQNTCLETGKFGNVIESKPCVRVKRKYNTIASKSKRLRIENDEMIELKLTWKEAQGLIRPPLNSVPQIITIDSCEIEEYEGEPIIGRPTIPSNDDQGEMIQWVQCEDCLKWRKLPDNILLPSRWTCVSNLWDPDRSVCSAAQECTREQLEALLPTIVKASLKKRSVKTDPDLTETVEGLNTLANLAVGEDGVGSSQTTTKHPRHKPGCVCIVCMQPPSGHIKHKQSCDCMPCESVKRRFKKMMMKRQEKQLLGKEGETDLLSIREGLFDEMEINGSPLKARIDLNIQPDREEEMSPCIGSVNAVHFSPLSQEQKQSCSGES